MEEMMKYRINELEPGLLDAAVAKAEGWSYRVERETWPDGTPNTRVIVDFMPSCNWAHGDPIIEREKIGTYWLADETQWRAGVDMHGYTPEFNTAQEHGPTRLIAAMRAFVASRLGAEVDL